MKNWLFALLAPFRQPEVSAAGRARVRPPARPAASLPASPAQAAPVAALAIAPALAPASVLDLDMGVFAWLLGQAVDPAAALTAPERQVLAQLDGVAADAGVQGVLLPRAAAVVPRLLAQLRGPDSSLSTLSDQVARDVTLVVEVIRMANSVGYRRGPAVVELEHAIRMLGVDGLRFAISRAVLKPLMDPRSGALSTRSARRLWQLTDSKAQLSAATARGLGCEPFDGYLLGLAHNAVWSVVLRTLDTAQPEATAWRFSAAFVRELNQRRDRLFHVVAQQWQLPRALREIAGEVAQRSLVAAGGSPLVQALRSGEQLASLLCIHDGAAAAAAAEPLLGGLPASVGLAWHGLTRSANDTPG